MLRGNDARLLNELFLACYFSYKNVNKQNLKDESLDIKKLKSNLCDIFYDGMDIVLEIMDEFGKVSSK